MNLGPDGRTATCGRCGLKVRYLAERRSTMMDWICMELAERRLILTSGFGVQPGRMFGDCDRIMELAVKFVMRD